MTEQPEYVIVPEIADRLRVFKITVHRPLETGRMPYIRLGRLDGVKTADLDHFIESNYVRPAEEG